MNERFYVAKVTKKELNGFFNEGSWNWNNMTSMIFIKNGKKIQVFGSGNAGDYGNPREVEFIADQSGRSLGFGRFFGYTDELKSGCSYYVLK